MVMIWTSWAALVVVGACTILTYNFFPTSNSQMSWWASQGCITIHFGLTWCNLGIPAGLANLPGVTGNICALYQYDVQSLAYT